MQLSSDIRAAFRRLRDTAKAIDSAAGNDDTMKALVAVQRKAARVARDAGLVTIDGPGDELHGWARLAELVARVVPGVLHPDDVADAVETYPDGRRVWGTDGPAIARWLAHAVSVLDALAGDADAAGTVPGKRGPKRKYDPIADKALAEKWARASGAKLSKAQFCEDQNITLTDLERTLRRIDSQKRRKR